MAESSNIVRALDPIEARISETTISSVSQRGRSSSQNFNEQASCKFCRNVVTRACEEMRNQTFPYPSFDMSNGDYRTTGSCPDCAVIASVAKAYNLNTISSLDVQHHPSNNSTVALLCFSGGSGQEYRRIYIHRAEGKYFYPFQHQEFIIVDSYGKAHLLVPQWNRIRLRASLSGDTSSPGAYKTINKWLATCLSDHESCAKDHVTLLPRRVLEIGESCVHLRDSRKLQAKYVCLSHCWGSNGAALQLNATNLQALRNGISKLQLPKTFRDAAQVCTMLGVRFIWIDALCILQDDPDDWLDAAANMAEIYEHAFLTIAATCSGDSNGGCFTRTRGEFKVHQLGSTGLYAQTPPPPFPYRQHIWGDEWPLLRRGWVLQERLLSPRVIHYARDQLYWECNSAFLSECGTTDWELEKPNQGSVAPLKHGAQFEPHASWRLLIETYTALNFTKENDLLLALAGMATHHMRLRCADTYVAGMWKSSLLEDLTFYHRKGPRPNSNIPTWSWASWQGPVKFQDVAKFPRLPQVELTHLVFTYHGPSNVGLVTNAHLRLKGPIFQAFCADLYSGLQASNSSLPGTEFLQVSLRLIGPCYGLASGLSFTVVLVSKCNDFAETSAFSTGIVLLEVREGVFERRGAVDLEFRTVNDDILENIEGIGDSYIASIPVEEVEIV